MQPIRFKSGKNKNFFQSLRKSHNSKQHIHDELKKDLEDVRAGKNLVGPFNNLDDLWKDLGI